MLINSALVQTFPAPFNIYIIVIKMGSRKLKALLTPLDRGGIFFFFFIFRDGPLAVGLFTSILWHIWC